MRARSAVHPIVPRVMHSILFAFYLLGQGNCSNPNDLKTGEYASEEYLALLSSCSPLKAAKSASPQSIKITSGKDGYGLHTYYDFNEGGPVYKLENGAPPKLVEGVGPNPEFERLDSVRMTFGYANHPKKTFRYVGNVNKFVSEKCLVGQYSGLRGENANFSAEGSFILNGVKKKYSVGPYFPPSFERDYFIADFVEYGFSRNRDTLNVFEVKNGSLFEDGAMSLSPAMVLVRRPVTTEH